MHADLETIRYKFGRDPAIFVVVEAICAKIVYKRADGQTDTRTNDGCRAIVLAHGMRMQSEGQRPPAVTTTAATTRTCSVWLL